MLSYYNGNSEVFLGNDGTRVILFPEDAGMQLAFPVSIDLKITNYCDMNKVYIFCHEMSNKHGKHADLKNILPILKQLPPGVEIAIGGGNPLSHPDLQWFLEELKSAGLIVNLTVNELHLKPYHDLILQLQNAQLYSALGVSYRGIFEYREFYDLFDTNTVLHIIYGMNQVQEVLRTPISKILVLGYKDFGNGDFERDFDIQIACNTPDVIEKFIKQGYIFAFDNLALDQLSEYGAYYGNWPTEYYQGNEGTLSMYIDSVNSTFSESSYNPNKMKIEENDTIQSLFSSVKDAAQK